jgi:hypothetical protein
MRNALFLIQKTLLIGVFLSTIILTSCKKDEGKGGKYSISGKVIAKYYTEVDNISLKQYTGIGAAQDEDVYLIYGNQPGYGERTKTNYKGEFEFKYLQAGNYTIYVYSKDTTQTALDNQSVVVYTLTISGSTTVPDLTIVREDNRDLEKGPYSIEGNATALNCDATFSVCQGPYPAIGLDVYITKALDEPYFDKQETFSGGKYKFSNLPPGKYFIYAISKNQFHIVDPLQPKEDIISTNVIISDQNVIASTLNVID